MSYDKFYKFPSWLRETAPRFSWKTRHQVFLQEALAKVTRGDCRRLILAMPPRHGKSETVTIRYAAWRLERDRKLKIIIGSYNQRLANRFSRQIRRIAEERGLQLAKDKRGAAEWETVEGGGVKAVGVGAGVTGFGGDLVIIDDPVKGRAQAESDVIRENVWDWFSSDIYTRLEPRASVILIQTRWHVDDLAGRLLNEMKNGGERWQEVKLPALAEEDDPIGRAVGDPLWSKRYDAAALKRIRRQLGSYNFSALYQQNPVPRETGTFKRKWFSRIVPEPPKGLAWARGYDLAVSTKTTSDYTASFRCAFDKKGDLYIADGYRARIEYPEQRRYVLERIKAETSTVHGVEKALHGQALVQDLWRERKVRGRALRAVKVDGDKLTRALTWAPQAEAGKVVLVDGHWIREFLDEVCSFPIGGHDDQVDAVSLAVRLLGSRPAKVHAFK